MASAVALPPRRGGASTSAGACSHWRRRRLGAPAFAGSRRLLRVCCRLAIAGPLCMLLRRHVAFSLGTLSHAALSGAPRVGSIAAGGLTAPLSTAAPTSSWMAGHTTRAQQASLPGAGGVARQALGPVEALDVEAASSLLTAFADQGTNINGILFQGSLPAYLLFLYFLSYRGNNTPPLVFFGFSFLLLFVFATIPTGIISKSTWGLALADSDWLHGTAESLLTCTNILLVLGFRGALARDAEAADAQVPKFTSGIWLAAVVATIAAGLPVFAWEAHTPFLGGVGDLPTDVLSSMPVFAQEPVNALSVPTWMVHWSTVFEFLLAMSLAWSYAEVSGNPRWKGLAWGMLPSHISSSAALTFHVFYNGIPWILTAQALFTFIGNLTLCIAASRIAISNGWTVAELDPRPAFGRLFGGGESASAPAEVERPSFDAAVLKETPAATDQPSGPVLAAEVVGLTLVAAYLTKYGELAIGSNIFQSPDSNLAAFLVVAAGPLLVFYTLFSSSPDLREGKLPEVGLAKGFEIPGFEGLSFEKVKQFGVAGTVAYILTEFAFWAIAFPFAAWSLYVAEGHWPDVIGNGEDRLAVFAAVFAGANIARLAVPLRFAVAIAFAPWVSENITSKFMGDDAARG